MKNKKLILLFLGLSFIVLFTVKLPKFLPVKTPQTLKALAYDSDKRLGYTVYIPENGKLEPYLVLTKNYDKQGNVLLMRKYLVEAAIPHNERDTSSYYAGSIPDKFMNELFIQEFPSKLRTQMAVSSVNIRAMEAVCQGSSKNVGFWSLKM